MHIILFLSLCVYTYTKRSISKSALLLLSVALVIARNYWCVRARVALHAQEKKKKVARASRRLAALEREAVIYAAVRQNKTKNRRQSISRTRAVHLSRVYTFIYIRMYIHTTLVIIIKREIFALYSLERYVYIIYDKRRERNDILERIIWTSVLRSNRLLLFFSIRYNLTFS